MYFKYYPPILILALLQGQVLISQAFNGYTSLESLANHDFSNCSRSVPKCYPLNTTRCLDITLPYKYTSLPHMNTVNISVNEFHETVNYINQYLTRWNGLRMIPSCWKALQLVLCSAFFPRCDTEKSVIWLPTKEMCRLVEHPCRMVSSFLAQHDFLRCNNATLFPAECVNKYTDIRFNTSSHRCRHPLVNTDDFATMYPGIDGCGVHCHNPAYTHSQQDNIRFWLRIGTFLSCALSLLCSLTFVIAKQYPSYQSAAAILFVIVMCLFMASLGWAIQFVIGPHDVACRADNTTRHAEPSHSGGSHWCLVSFCLTYFFSYAVLIGFVHLSFAVAQICEPKHTGRHQEERGKSRGMSILYANGLTILSMIAILGFNLIDGNYMLGICTVGLLNQNYIINITLVYGPFYGYAFTFVSNMARACKGIHNAKSYKGIKGPKREKLHRMFYVMLLSIVWMSGAAISATLVIVDQIGFDKLHNGALRENILCQTQVNMSSEQHYEYQLGKFSEFDGEARWRRNAIAEPSYQASRCRQKQNARMWKYYLPLFFYFSASLVVLSWICSPNTYHMWKQFLADLCRGRGGKMARKRKVYFHRNDLEMNKTEIIKGTYVPKPYQLDPIDMELDSIMSRSVTASMFENLNNFMHRKTLITASIRSLLELGHQSTSNSLSDFSSVNSDTSANESSEVNSTSVPQPLPPHTTGRTRNVKRKTRMVTRSASDTSGADSLISAAFVASKKFRNKLPLKFGNRENESQGTTTAPSPQETLEKQAVLVSQLVTTIQQQAQMMQTLQAFQTNRLLALTPGALSGSSTHNSASAIESAENDDMKNVKSGNRRRLAQAVEEFQFTHGMIEQNIPSRSRASQADQFMTDPFEVVRQPAIRESRAKKSNKSSPFVEMVDRVGNNLVTTNFQLSSLVANQATFGLIQQPVVNSHQQLPFIPRLPLGPNRAANPYQRFQQQLAYYASMNQSSTSHVMHAGSGDNTSFGNQGHLVPPMLMQAGVRPNFVNFNPKKLAHYYNTEDALRKQLEEEADKSDAEELQRQRNELAQLVTARQTDNESTISDYTNIVISDSEYATDASRSNSRTTLRDEKAKSRKAEEQELIHEVSKRLEQAEL